MLRLLSDFLRSPSNFLQNVRRQMIVVISLFTLLFICVLFSIYRNVAHQSIALEAEADSPNPTPVAPEPTQTKWWVRPELSKTPSSRLPIHQTLVADTGTSAALGKCPAYAAALKSGTYGYISLFPPDENLLRSGAGKNYPAVGFIEIGGWVKILSEPVCDDGGYVWLNVQSAAASSSWTAAGYKASQWVIACPDPNKKCSKSKTNESISATPNPNNSGNNNQSICLSDKLAVGLDAQVSRMTY